jgi:ADP-ribosylglycohydrolase
MSGTSTTSRQERVLGGLWASLVGDALGVPVEFKDRATVQANPVREMRGFGTHKQPPGTWSDDGALILCTVESLLTRDFDLEDMGARFLDWMKHGRWSAWGEPFDVGMTTTDAILRIENGTPAKEAGSRDEYSNGNGSLMRIIPVVLRLAMAQVQTFAAGIEAVSSITHAHERSRMACVFYGLVTRGLLSGEAPEAAVASARVAFGGLYEKSPEFAHFHAILDGDISSLPEGIISSTGYVLHTLHASLWCLLTTECLADCILRAVNLGCDTDTTGCVAGGLAGVAYGVRSIPADWIDQLARKDELDRLFREFFDLCSKTGMK